MNRRRRVAAGTGRLALLAAVVMLTLAAVTATTVAPGARPVAAGQQDEPPAGGIAAGERVFQNSCAMCHGADASGMMGMHPSLRGAVRRLSREGVEVTIRRGRRTEPPMPAFEDRLSDDEIGDVIAYVASLPLGPRNFGPGDGGGMMNGPETGDGGLRAIVVALAVLAAAAAALVFAARLRSSPAAALDRRYAGGKLSRDDYLQARRDLHLDDSP